MSLPLSSYKTNKSHRPLPSVPASLLSCTEIAAIGLEPVQPSVSPTCTAAPKA
ncbi:hypothetical protein EXN66_Car016545 [Channa argus]|uniref:Uncharacterized protein n=1 Tax=Channa argus TaxID=215402 RepID=A0A6G1QEE6_CHAAH|nr:hypothetical protein EXN66_Car016545 [Channa argus]